MAKIAQVPAYRIRITLNGVKPLVWRRVVLPGAWPLSKVHDAIQLVMGWTDSHLHEFEVGSVRWGRPDPGWGTGEVRREATGRLHEVVPAVGDKFLYTYDFGDDWPHTLLVEELLPPQRVATCSAGSGACPARTAEASGATRSWCRSWPTPGIRNIKNAWSGRADRTTRRPLTWPMQARP